jgi:hypothetical protein
MEEEGRLSSLLWDQVEKDESEMFLIPYFQVTSSSSISVGGRGGTEEGLWGAGEDFVIGFGCGC